MGHPEPTEWQRIGNEIDAALAFCVRSRYIGIKTFSLVANASRRTVWIVDAHGYGKRFVVRADEKLAASVEFESACSCECDLLAKNYNVEAAPHH